MPEISIVLPTYNGEKYLKQSIESILGQTYTDWELIVVNDCSTDSTQEIIDFYRKKDTRIRTIFNYTNQKLPESLKRKVNILHGHPMIMRISRMHWKKC